MARRRRYSYRKRRAQRTLLQIAVLVVVLVFIGLNNPAVRTSVNATLVWLTIRALIGGVSVLAIAWTYQFLRPPKVKRRKISQPQLRKSLQPQRNQSPVSNGKSTDRDWPMSDTRTIPARHSREEILEDPRSGVHSL